MHQSSETDPVIWQSYVPLRRELSMEQRNIWPCQQRRPKKIMQENQQQSHGVAVIHANSLLCAVFTSPGSVCCAVQDG
jgi:hypothetical protein